MKFKKNLLKNSKQYNIDCTINKSKGNYYLRFNKENSLKLLKLVGPYIHNSMDCELGNREQNYEWGNNFLDHGLLRVTEYKLF